MYVDREEIEGYIQLRTSSYGVTPTGGCLWPADVSPAPLRAALLYTY